MKLFFYVFVKALLSLVAGRNPPSKGYSEQAS